MIGMVLSAGKATMTEITSTLSLEDLHDIVEVIVVDGHNAIKRQRRERE